MTALLFILIAWVAPIVICVGICDERNRDPWKGAFVGVFLGWLAVVGLWLSLKRRSAETQMLY